MSKRNVNPGDTVTVLFKVKPRVFPREPNDGPKLYQYTVHKTASAGVATVEGGFYASWDCINPTPEQFEAATADFRHQCEMERRKERARLRNLLAALDSPFPWEPGYVKPLTFREELEKELAS